MKNKIKLRTAISTCLLLYCCAALAAAGPRATALRITWIYVAPNQEAQKLDRVQIGREMVVAERSGAWLRVFANTDVQTERARERDQPEFGSSEAAPPVSGWIEAKGVVLETTPDGDRILMGEASHEEEQASDPRGPANAARAARRLYLRLAEFYPNSPLRPEACWRAADIAWQLQKADLARLPSARERDPRLHERLDEAELKKIEKGFPHTRQADLAAYARLDVNLCGDWQGQTNCPERESELYEHYAAEHPDGPRTAPALYQAVYRQAALANLYASQGANKKSAAARSRAQELAARLKEKFPQSDSACRAAALLYRLEEGVAVYGASSE